MENLKYFSIFINTLNCLKIDEMSEVLFLGCFYGCSSTCINGLISPQREVQNMLFMCFKVWPMLKPLMKMTCFEESSFRFREIVKRRGYHTRFYIVCYFSTDWKNISWLRMAVGGWLGRSSWFTEKLRVNGNFRDVNNNMASKE